MSEQKENLAKLLLDEDGPNIQTVYEVQGVVLGLTGFAQTGKDSVGKILINKYGFKRLSFADALRTSLYRLNPKIDFEIKTQKQGFWEWLNGEPERREVKTLRIQDLVKSPDDSEGWDKAKVQYAEVRTLLQLLGTEAGREIHGYDCWINIVKRQIEANPHDNFVITDVRFPNEKGLVERLGGHVVRIEREGVTAVNNHISDRLLEGVNSFIRNDFSLSVLEMAVKELLTGVLKEQEITSNLLTYKPN